MSKRRRKSANSGNGKVDLVSLIISIIFGVIWSVIGGFLYNILRAYDFFTGKFNPIMIMAVYFGGLAIVLFVAAVICNAVKDYHRPKKEDYIKALITVVIIMVASGIFQFIYSIEITEKITSEGTSYVFLIDDSYSMNDSDPYGQRYEAIKTVMKNVSSDKKFCVYSFSTNCTRLTDMIPASKAETMLLRTETNGLTMILDSLKTVMSDIKSGNISCGKGGRVILLTDGYPTDFYSGIELRNTLKEFNDRGISVSAVGFGDCDDDYLQNLADMTNGKYVRARNASELSDAMVTASEAKSDYYRNLINHRNPVSSWVEYLYGFERMVFIILLGVAFIYLKSLLLRSNDSSSNLLVAHIIIIAIGALGIEIGMNVFYWSEVLMRLIMCITFSLIFVTQEKKPRYVVDDEWGDYQETPLTANEFDDIYSGY